MNAPPGLPLPARVSGGGSSHLAAAYADLWPVRKRAPRVTCSTPPLVTHGLEPPGY